MREEVSRGLLRNNLQKEVYFGRAKNSVMWSFFGTYVSAKLAICVTSKEVPRLRDSITSLRSTNNSNGFSCTKFLGNRHKSNFFAKMKSHTQKIFQAEPKHCMGFLEQLNCLSLRMGLRSQDTKFFAMYNSDKNLKIQISLASLLPFVNLLICFRNFTNSWQSLSNKYQRDSNC